MTKGCPRQRDCERNNQQEEVVEDEEVQPID